MVQRRAARYVRQDYSRESSVTDMLRELQWPLLQNRRKAARLILFYKAVHGLVAISIPATVIHQQRETRQYHPERFIMLGSTSDTYKYSFIPRTITDWNRLPPAAIQCPTVDTFKAAVQGAILTTTL